MHFTAPAAGDENLEILLVLYFVIKLKVRWRSKQQILLAHVIVQRELEEELQQHCHNGFPFQWKGRYIDSPFILT